MYTLCESKQMVYIYLWAWEASRACDAVKTFFRQQKISQSRLNFSVGPDERRKVSDPTLLREIDGCFTQVVLIMFSIWPSGLTR